MEDFFTASAAFLRQYFSKELVVFLISICPVLELRGGIIAAHFLNMNWIEAFLICFIANIIPVIFILLFVRRILEWMKTTKLFKRLAEKIIARSEKKRKSIDDPWLLRFMLKTKGFRRTGERLKSDPKYREKVVSFCKIFALFTFVAIPLPGTGAYTGSIIAALMDLRIKQAFPAIAAGVLVAGFIVAALTYGLLASIGIG